MATRSGFDLSRLSGLTNLAPGDLFEQGRDTLLRCLPEVLRRAFGGTVQRWILQPSGTQATLYTAQSGRRETLGQIDENAPEALRAMLAGSQRNRRMVVELPPEQLLQRTVLFPAQVRDNLRQVLGYEIDRLSPFRGDEVFFDYRLQEGPSAERLAVELVVCRRDAVTPWLERLREAGTPADRLAWEGAWPKANLLPVRERPKGQRISTTTIVLLVIIVLLLAGVAITPLWQRQQELEMLRAQASELSRRSDAVYRTREALERARQGSVEIIKRKSEQPRMIDLLRALSDQFGDDTWIQNVTLRDGKITIRGESSNATALIGVLEKMQGVSEIEFRSGPRRATSTGRENYNITFKYTRPEPS